MCGFPEVDRVFKMCTPVENWHLEEKNTQVEVTSIGNYSSERKKKSIC